MGCQQGQQVHCGIETQSGNLIQPQDGQMGEEQPMGLVWQWQQQRLQVLDVVVVVVGSTVSFCCCCCCC